MLDVEVKDCLNAGEGVNFENKIVLSIAIRLAAGKFMIKKINDEQFMSSIRVARGRSLDFQLSTIMSKKFRDSASCTERTGMPAPLARAWSYPVPMIVTMWNMAKCEGERDLSSVPDRTSQRGAADVKMLILVFLLVLYVGALAVFTMQRNSIYENAVTLWKSIVDNAPSKQRPRQNYANALLAMGSQNSDARLYWQALRELQTVLDLPEDGSVEHSYVYQAIGSVYFHFDMPDEAIRTWKGGLELFPSDPALESNIAFALVAQSKYDEALDYALSARTIAPMMPAAANMLGLIYLEKGDWHKAAEQFLQYQKLRPEESLGYWNAALAFERAGDYAKAKDIAMLSLERERDQEQRSTAQSFVKDMESRLRSSSK